MSGRTVIVQTVNGYGFIHYGRWHEFRTKDAARKAARNAIDWDYPVPIELRPRRRSYEPIRISQPSPVAFPGGVLAASLIARAAGVLLRRRAGA